MRVTLQWLIHIRTLMMEMFLDKLVSLKHLMLLSAQDDFIKREHYYELKHHTCLHDKN